MSVAEAFNLDEHGNIISMPLLGYTTAPVAGMFVLARLEYAESESHYEAISAALEKPSAVQLAISPVQAKELAARLNLLADHILSEAKPPNQQQN